MLSTTQKNQQINGHKSWFITGATRGIGAEIAKAVVVDGNQVVAGDRKPEVVIKALGTYL
jgi:NAD(P)-dependent dehydrogenase (short-subunit alcohol dehydrogenase family)